MIRKTLGLVAAIRWPQHLLRAGQGGFASNGYTSLLAAIALYHPQLLDTLYLKVEAKVLDEARAELNLVGLHGPFLRLPVQHSVSDMPVWKVSIPYAALVVLVALLMLCAAWTGWARRPAGTEARPTGAQFRALTLTGGGVLALARLSAFWFLLYREWTGTKELSFIIFVVFLYPEGLVLPREETWTVPGALLFSGFLDGWQFRDGGFIGRNHNPAAAARTWPELSDYGAAWR